MSPLALLATLAFAVGVATLATSRQPRWFLRVGTVTQLVTENVVVTQMTPSSCVEVAPSLPPCRHLRQMEIAPSATTSVEITRDLDGGRAFWDGWLAPSKQQPDDELVAPTPEEQDVAVEPTVNRWRINQLFDGLYATVTQTVVQEATARIDDAQHVITFSVVGCLPTQLPFDLALCQPVVNGVHEAPEKAASAVVGPDPRSID